MRLSGKLAVIFLLYAGVAFPEVWIEIRSMEKRALQQACAGTPFTIEVILENCDNPSQPQLSVPPECKCQPTGVSTVDTISGSLSSRKKKYSYLARIDAPGSYTIGPAVVKTGNNTRFESEPRELVVSDSMIFEENAQSGHTRSKKHKRSVQKEHQEPVYVQAELDKKSIVVGETCHLLITFYSSDSSVNLERIIETDYKALGFQADETVPMKTGTKNIDGTVYSYVQVKRELKPSEPGTFTIPACKVDYSVRSGHTDFFSLMLGRRVVKTIYSNGLTLEVEPLPLASDSVDFLGSCSHFLASLDQHSIQQSEAATLRFEVEGDLEWSKDTLHVVDVPSGLRLFPSQQSCKQTKSGKKYIFEYVLQACGKPGDYTLPAQTIVGFDTKLRKIVQLTTHEIPFSILEVTPNVSTSQNKKIAVDQTKQQIEQLPLIIDSWTPYTSKVIPWWLFIWLSILPMGTVILARVLRILYLRIIRLGIVQRIYVRWLTERAITRARAHKKSEDLYEIMKKFLSLTIPKSEELYKNYNAWVESVCSKEQFVQWVDFMKTLQEKKFCKKSSLVNYDEDQLFLSAIHWCRFLAEAARKKQRQYALGILLPLFLITSFGYANDQEHFLQGNKLYGAGSYKQAHASYEKMKRKGYAAYFNMGNCCYQEKDYSRALYYWKKAASCCPSDRVSACHDHSAKAYEALNVHQSDSVRKHTISLLMLQLIFLFFLYILLACWWSNMLSKLSSALVCALLMVTGWTLYARYDHDQKQQAIVLCATKRYAGPGGHYHVLGTVETAQTVEVNGSHERWVKINYNGSKGWIAAEDLLVI